MIEVFLKAARGTVKYGYFAPLIAAWLSVKRRGGYFWHLRALYKLTFWHGKRYP